jgi:enterobactin synthetase component D
VGDAAVRGRPELADVGLRAEVLAQLRSWLPLPWRVVGTGASADLTIPAADRALVDGAVPRRRAEFVAGRWCAHRALQLLQVPCDALPADRWGAPLWPAGVIGAITHEEGCCIAVAAGARELGLDGVGIDLCARGRRETIAPLASLILSAHELHRHASHADPLRHLQMLFSAKESVVKAVSRRAGRYLDLREMTLQWRGLDFVAGMDGLRGEVAGRCHVLRGHVLTLATLADDTS